MTNRKDKSDNYSIKNEKDYNATMKKIDALMKKREANLTNKEAEALRILALAAQGYEKSMYTIPAPDNPPLPEEDKNLVMQVELRIPGTHSLMGAKHKSPVETGDVMVVKPLNLIL